MEDNTIKMDALKILEENLKTAKEAKESENKKYTNGIIGSLIVLALLVLILLTLFFFAGETGIGRMFFYILSIISGLFLLIVLGLIFDRGAVKRSQIVVDEASEELELYHIRNEDEKILAGKQFKIHQKDLKRYYDLNLSQIKFLSRLGIFLIFLGSAIIVAAIALYWLQETSELIFPIIIIISGILIDGIGAFFISMYTQNMKAAIVLHSSLAASNNLLLANFIVAKIEDKNLKENTLSDIAKNISTTKADSRLDKM